MPAFISAVTVLYSVAASGEAPFCSASSQALPSSRIKLVQYCASPSIPCATLIAALVPT